MRDNDNGDDERQEVSNSADIGGQLDWLAAARGGEAAE
jgi:hypothetical protein